MTQQNNTERPRQLSEEEIQQRAKQILEGNQIFPPHKNINYHSMILIEGLPSTKSEKEQKVVIKRFYSMVIKPIYESIGQKFDVKDITIGDQGQYAVMRCQNEKIAQQIIKQYSGTNTVYSSKYYLTIRDYNDIYLQQQKYSQEPTLQEACAPLNYVDRYDHNEFIVNSLPTYQVLIQCRIRDITEEQKQRQLCKYYLAEFNNLGDYKVLNEFLDHQSARWSPKGNFLVTKPKIDQVFIKQITKDRKLQLILEIDLNQFKDETVNEEFSSDYSFTSQISSGEKFLVIYEQRVYKNISQIRMHIYSIYENKRVFDTNWITKQEHLSLEQHLQFIYDDTRFYLVENTVLNIYKVDYDPIAQIQPINTFSIGVLADISIHQKYPLIAYYNIPIQDKPSAFQVINVKNRVNQMKIISKALFVSNIKIQWSKEQKVVSLVLNSREATSIASFNMEVNPIKQQNFKFHANTQIFDFSINNDVTTAVIACQQGKERKVLIQSANTEQQPRQVLVQPIQQVRFSNQQKIIQLVNYGTTDVHITYCDESGQSIKNYDFNDVAQNNDNKLYMDQFNNLCAIIDKSVDPAQLNIIDSKGTIILVKSLINPQIILWRPLDYNVLNKQQDIQMDKQQYEEMVQNQIQQEMQFKQQKLDKQIQEFNSIFYNEESNKYYEKMTQAEEELLGENALHDDDFVEVEILQIKKNEPIERKITDDEYITIKQEAYSKELIKQ